MKIRSLILICALFLAIESYAQSGIQFVEKPWAELLAQAKAENKLIFIDAYTTWCGPCKALARNVFPLKEVGEAYNSQFVNTKFDMEKGEGTMLADKFEVRAYPTLLFVDGDGNLVHRGVGYHEAPELIELSKAASDPSRQLSTLGRRYQNGDRDPAFLKGYAIALKDSYDPKASQVGEAYLATQSDWSTAENKGFILQFGEREDSKVFQYLLDHADEFRKEFGDEQVDQQLQNVMVTPLLRQYSNNEALLFTKAQEAFKKIRPAKADEFMAAFKMRYYSGLNKQAQFEAAAVEYLDKYGSEDYGLLNQVAWNFYEHVSDIKLLRKALEWAKKSVKLSDGYANNDTLAALYYKTGNKEKAIAAAEHAIELGKKEGEDVSETEALLAKIKG